jgi:phospho-N-acetylmuramoyl-pentapeptide-transferase
VLKLLSLFAQKFMALNVFRYLTFRAAYAAVTALLIAFLFAPKIIEKLHVLKYGQSIRSDGPQTHQVKSGTPTMGGLFIILSVSVAVLLWADLANIHIWVCLMSFLAFGAIGFVDDMLKIKLKNSDGISALLKLALQIAVSTAAVLVLYFNKSDQTTQLYVPFFKNPVIDLGIAWIPLAILSVSWWSNAVNITDGLDGLSSGLSIIVLVALGVLTYLTGRPDFAGYLDIPFVRGSSELIVFCLAMMGAVVGFLWFNAHPAEIFMGDVGSLSIGGVFGIIALILKKEILFIFIGGVFFLELASVVIQVVGFKLTGKRVFKMAPLHHHFELKGWKETQVVTRFWILGGMFAIIALSTLKTQ